jgi:hypothetical protein
VKSTFVATVTDSRKSTVCSYRSDMDFGGVQSIGGTIMTRESRNTGTEKTVIHTLFTKT